MAIAACRRRILLSLAEKLLEIGTPIIAEAMRLEVATGGVVEDVIDGRPCVFLLTSTARNRPLRRQSSDCKPVHRPRRSWMRIKLSPGWKASWA
jgi:hypothetical protein